MPSSSRSRGPRLACRPRPPESFILRGVRLFDPSLPLDLAGDLLIEGGRIAAVGEGLSVPEGAETIDRLSGCAVFPGFVDMHVHLRTPGQEYKEDLESASMAAVAGGFVVVAGMANTAPAIDSGPLATWVLDQALESADVLVGQVGAVSRGLRGEELAELRELADAGVVAFSDDGRPIGDADLLLHALRYLQGTGRRVLLHLEERSLAVDGAMHEGRWSARLGLRGIPSAAESGPLARDLELLRYTCREASDRGVDPVPLHLQHLSSVEAVRLVEKAKAEGLPVTAEVTPHHLLLIDERVRSFDQSLKMNPPLRAEADRQALVQGLADGVIDCVATDHAPHAPHEKEVPFEEAPFGTVGLETAFAALYGGLVVPGSLQLARLISALSTEPSRCLGIEPPTLAVGAPAHLCVVDLEETWRVGLSDLRGKSRNSAFLGEQVQGRVIMTVVDGGRRYMRGARHV